MAGKTSSPHLSGSNGETAIKIKKPSADTARAIRDAILRDYFGYTNSDIEELDAQQPGKFFICVSGGNGKTEMTPEQVRGWLPDSSGMISIVLDDYWLKNLHAFREQRAEAVLNQSIGAIADAKTRSEVLEILEKILKSGGNDRITALNNLVTIGSSNGSVSNALAYLTAQDRYANNPFLLLARAKLDTINHTTKSGPGYDTLIQPLLSQAVKQANEGFNSIAVNNSLTAINRADAAYINREAAWMFAQIGKDREFQERDWLARFYAMSDRERAELQEGDVILITEPGPSVMSTPRPRTETEKMQDDLNEREKQRKIFESNMDKGRGILETNDPRAVDRTEIIPNTTITTEIKGSSFPGQQRKDGFPRGQNQRILPPGKNTATTSGARINPSSIKSANVVGGAAELIVKGFNARIFHVRMKAVTEYLAEKERLEKVIVSEKRRVVPLKPATIEKLLADFRQQGRKTANPFEKEKILKIIIKLENMREESYAMWR